ncbi:hypothetical protein D3C78_1887910 [compost metagenome]
MSAWLLLPSRMNAGLTPAGRLGSCAAAHQPMSPLALAQTIFRPGAWTLEEAVRALARVSARLSW